jgi:hypothetical protein
LHGRLEVSDYVDDACLLSQMCKDISENIRNLHGEAATAGLKINSKKTEELWINSKITTNINVNTEVTETVGQLTYLGSVVTVDGGEIQDLKARIKQAHGIFGEVYPLRKKKNGVELGYNVMNGTEYFVSL